MPHPSRFPPVGRRHAHSLKSPPSPSLGFLLILFLAAAVSAVPADQRPAEVAEAAVPSFEDAVERQVRAGPLRWGKRANGILRWGKREPLRWGKRAEDQLIRPAREAPLRWGKRSIKQDHMMVDQAEPHLMREVREPSPLRWGKRAPLRWGKRAPSRFGKKRAPFRFGKKRSPMRFGKRLPSRFGKRLMEDIDDSGNDIEHEYYEYE